MADKLKQTFNKAKEALTHHSKGKDEVKTQPVEQSQDPSNPHSKPFHETQNTLEDPASKEELQKRTQELNQDPVNNKPTDEIRTQPIDTQGEANAFSKPFHVTENNLEEPLSKAELDKRTAELNK